jgi:hypothetical protein
MFFGPSQNAYYTDERVNGKRNRALGGVMKILLALVMLALAAGAQAQLVKCVSKGGKVEYAQSCPEGTTEQKMRSGLTSGTSGAPSTAPPRAGPRSPSPSATPTSRSA